jgi:hypothetical protein
MRLILVALFLASAATEETAYYRIDLAPSGSQVSIGAPVVKGSMVVFHGYPDGKLMSVRRSEVKAFARITLQEAAGPPAKSLTSIGNLAMQGSSASAPGAARPAGSQAPGQPPHIVPTQDGLAITTSAAPPK